jgi:paired amphipathic helix protein Sin3a
MKIINLWDKERIVPTSVRQEAVYRLTVESNVAEDIFFRFEYNVAEKVVTIQLLNKEEDMGDGVGAQEKWSVYVDHFVQFVAGQNTRGPFLTRNIAQGLERGDVVSRSGLELKICVNTYRIYFVDGTEDFMMRRGSANEGARKGKGVLDGFWRRGLSVGEVTECMGRYERMVKGG